METVTLAYKHQRAALDEAGSSAERLRLGAVYTPAILADWVAQLALDLSTTSQPDVLDFGCGEGALLTAIASKAPNASLAGADTNALAVRRAKQNLPAGSKLFVQDVLDLPTQPTVSLRDYWVRRIGSNPNVLIMNPPWGAEHTVSSAAARQSGLSLARGQYDTYDLFCELGLQVIAQGGVYALILPDSLFLPEHEALRALLSTKTTIHLIARLGEGVFEGVYRGCVVVVGRKQPPSADHAVECLRLTKAERSRISSGLSFSDVCATLTHAVPQSRFSSDKHFRFDIDVSQADRTVFAISQQGGDWTKHLISSRGTELSKHGKVVLCKSCGLAHPLPKGEFPRCRGCGTSLNTDDVTLIVRPSRSRDGSWAPFIVGEDVSRYEARPRRWIKTGVSGINYKKRNKKGEARLLIRKTGVGIHATIDESDAVTNQVVFDYKMKPSAKFPFSYLHYILGVLCSRAMFAYHLKRGGEMEWRSHPYLTQKTIAQLPIPVPRQGTESWAQAAAIASAVQRHLKTGLHDMEIEGLVAGLLNLNAKDLEWVQLVLEQAADLEPMRRLRVSDLKSLCVIRAD